MRSQGAELIPMLTVRHPCIQKCVGNEELQSKLEFSLTCPSHEMQEGRIWRTGASGGP